VAHDLKSRKNLQRHNYEAITTTLPRAALSVCIMEVSIRALSRNLRAIRHPSSTAASPMAVWRRRQFSSDSRYSLPAPMGMSSSGSQGSSTSYFQKPSLPANTVIRFVPQQTAWIVERMGKFNRILQPGLAILIPVLERIAYVQSLKESAVEIPSQSAITADNVTLELDGVLYTRVFDPYKARCESHSSLQFRPLTESQLWCRRCRVCHLPACADNYALRDRPAHTRSRPQRACGSKHQHYSSYK
jgi:hypothetical protein